MKDYIKSVLWGIAGLLVGFSTIAQNVIPFIGYFLIVLSILMFVLAISQFKQRKN